MRATATTAALLAMTLATCGAAFAHSLGGGLEQAPPLAAAGIVASLIVLGLLVLVRVRPPVWAGAMLIAPFALAHGHAHGAEMPLDAAAAYAAGFVVACGALISVGAAIAAAGAQGRRIVPGTGALSALAGVVLAAA
jgi:urease accessory protein